MGNGPCRPPPPKKKRSFQPLKLWLHSPTFVRWAKLSHSVGLHHRNNSWPHLSAPFCLAHICRLRVREFGASFNEVHRLLLTFIERFHILLANEPRNMADIDGTIGKEDHIYCGQHSFAQKDMQSYLWGRIVHHTNVGLQSPILGDS